MSLKIDKKNETDFFKKFWTIRILMQRTESTILHLNTSLQVLCSRLRF